jgi:hypothetical protein
MSNILRTALRTNDLIESRLIFLFIIFTPPILIPICMQIGIRRRIDVKCNITDIMLHFSSTYFLV